LLNRRSNRCWRFYFPMVVLCTLAG
jgi:hypothetical protein